jgi:hypothetical protein
VVLPPTITGLSATSGAAGTAVTITGTNFGPTQGSSTVTFNGTAATPSSWSNTSIAVAVPIGATTGNVVVTVNGVTSNGVNFTAGAGAISLTGAMTTARVNATATVLDNGTALLLGGVDRNGSPLSSAEIYNPATGTFSPTGNLITGRSSHTATLLDNGTVLVTGGSDASGNILASAEIYNPATGTFAAAGNMTAPRYFHTATLLNDGTVLIAGMGWTAEIYNPAASTFTPTGSMNTWRTNQTATLLDNGTVLIAGGQDNYGNILASAELYNPATGTFSLVGSLSTARAWHTATLLNNGKVLVAGGFNPTSFVLDSTELYDPIAGSFSGAGNLLTGRVSHTAALLNNGTVLIAGGWDANYNVVGNLESFDPTVGTFGSAGNLNTPRAGSTETLLPNGTDLIAAGVDSNGNVLSSAELYQPGTLVPPGLVSIAISPANPSIVLGSSQHFAATGTFSDNSTQVLVSATWTSSNSPIATVSNDATNYANAWTLALGTSTLSACTGSICGSTTLTVGVPTPAILSLSPTYGPLGANVTIAGTNFGTTQGTSTVTFNGTLASIASWGATSIQTQVPQGATSGNVVVTVDGAASRGVPFTVAPNIISLSPVEGSAGTVVTISGTNFGAAQGSSTVTFNGVAGTPTNWSATSITAPVPAGATSGNVVVTVGGVASNGVLFGLTVPGPNIFNVSPSSGPAGTPVTITGEQFGDSQGSGTVTLGTSAGTVISWSSTQIVALVVPGSTTGIAQVTQGGLASNSVTFTVATPTISAVSPTSGSVGTAVTIFGSGFGTTQGSGKLILGTNYGTIVSWADTSILATVSPGSTSGTVQLLLASGPTNSLTFTVNPPTLSTVSPTSGPAGTEVTLTGSGFGATQGSGRVLLGTANAGVVSWSDSLIVATVGLGSSSGVAQVWQGGVGSSTETFTVTTPNIAGISPTSGAAGTQVTISGSGFGATQGSGAVWLGSAYATVVSWSDAQVVASVATGSATGVAQVLQSGVWSNSISFSTLTPQISSVSPTSGTAGTVVTITGSGFGASQGSGTLMLGSATGIVSTWTDTQVVAAVSANAATGSVRIEQNGIWSNALRFVVPTNGSGNNQTLVPSVVSMLVGQTRTLQALNSSGQEALGLTWTSSDTTVASLSTDDPPIITALAPGHVTITAGDSSADLTVYSGYALPTGTVIWSAPGDGSGVRQILPAVPSPTGVADVFALQTDGTVQALRTDGSVGWNASVGTGNTLLPDFQGGLVVASYTSIQRLDGMTGQVDSQYTYTGTPSGYWAVHTDGTIFTVDGSSLVGIDPTTGSAKFSIPLEQTTMDESGCSPNPSPEPPTVGQLMIAGDGYAYALYYYTNTTENSCLVAKYLEVTIQHVRVMRVSSSGSAQEVTIADWSSAYSYTSYYPQPAIETADGSTPSQISGTLVTNANTGISVALHTAFAAYCGYTLAYFGGNPVGSDCVPATYENRLVVISNGSIVSDSYLNLGDPEYAFTPVLQRQDGTYFGVNLSSLGSMDAFDQSGNVKWSVPNFYPYIATADGGVIAQSTTTGQYVTFDQNGVADGMLPSLPTYSWTNDWYSTSASMMVNLALPSLYLANAYLALPSGNASGTPTAFGQQPYPPLPSCTDNNSSWTCPGPREAIYNAYYQLEHDLNPLSQTGCPGCSTVFATMRSNGANIDQVVFLQFLSRTPQFYNGRLSTANAFATLCGPGNTCTIPVYQSVMEYMDQGSNVWYGAVTRTPSDPGKGMLTFFDPVQVCGSQNPSSGHP